MRTRDSSAFTKQNDIDYFAFGRIREGVSHVLQICRSTLLISSSFLDRRVPAQRVKSLARIARNSCVHRTFAKDRFAAGYFAGHLVVTAGTLSTCKLELWSPGRILRLYTDVRAPGLSETKMLANN